MFQLSEHPPPQLPKQPPTLDPDGETFQVIPP